MNLPDEQQTATPNRGRPGFRVTQRALLLLAAGVFLIQAGFIVGLLVERNIVQGGQPAAGELSLVSSVYSLIEEDYYYQPGPATPAADFERSLEYGAASGMLGGLDGYSQFLPPREASQAAAELAGQYEGIGIQAEFVDGALTVITPMIGSPAESADIQPEDVIIAVDGKPLLGLRETDALDLVRGPAGTTVELMIQRADRREPVVVNVTRKAIVVPVVSYRLLPRTSVAYIQVAIFGDTTASQLESALDRAAADEADAIILDLRRNGGGWVQSAQEVIGRFVEADGGPALYEDTAPGPGGEESLPILDGELEIVELPMAVLVDEGTASAAEIVAGALQDYERATIVGQKTFGKGSVQRVYEFDDGSSARITFAEWLTPEMHRIEGQGVTPDVVVALKDDSGSQGDGALQQALSAVGAESTALPIATPSATPVSMDG